MDIYVLDLNFFIWRKLSCLLDLFDFLGKDWCFFVMNLGFFDFVVKYNINNGVFKDFFFSFFYVLLWEWIIYFESMVGIFMFKLRELGCWDVVDFLLKVFFVFKINLDGNG